MSALLELRHVSLVYGHGEQAVHALRQVSIEVQPGELVAVMGASGSGKSTLLFAMGGLSEPTTGEVRLGGSAGGAPRRADRFGARGR